MLALVNAGLQRARQKIPQNCSLSHGLIHVFFMGNFVHVDRKKGVKF